MKKSWNIIISLLAGAGALWIIFTQFSVHSIWMTIKDAPWWSIVGYVVVSVAIMASLAWRWDIILRAKGIRISFWHVMWYRIIGYGVSYMTPGAKIGGEAVRAKLLLRHEAHLNKGLSTVVIDKIMEVSTAGFFFLVGAVAAFMMYEVPLSLKIATIVITLWIALIFGSFYFQMFRGKYFFKPLFRFLRLHHLRHGHSLEEKLERFERVVMHFFRKKQRAFLGTFLTSLLAWLLMFAEYWFILSMLRTTDISFNMLFLIITFIGGSYLIPVPMALGVLEAGQVSAFHLIGLAKVAGVALALVTRTKDLVWTVLGLIALSLYGLHPRESVKEAKFVGAELKYLEKLEEQARLRDEDQVR